MSYSTTLLLSICCCHWHSLCKSHIHPSSPCALYGARLGCHCVTPEPCTRTWWIGIYSILLQVTVRNDTEKKVMLKSGRRWLWNLKGSNLEKQKHPRLWCYRLLHHKHSLDLLATVFCCYLGATVDAEGHSLLLVLQTGPFKMLLSLHCLYLDFQLLMLVLIIALHTAQLK